MKLGITIRDYIGVGDKIQFSSLPENYYRHTGRKLVDISKSWIFDHNPFVVRDQNPDKTVELWNWPKQYEWPQADCGVYRSNAEIWAKLFTVPARLIRPRLYQFEEVTPYEKRKDILFHVTGRSNGKLPDRIISHVLDKYSGTGRLYQIGLAGDDIGIKRFCTPTLWDLARVISGASMVISVDSGPCWIAACYPDVIVKRIRLKETDGAKNFQELIPLERDNFHSHWDDRAFQTYCDRNEDTGFMQSYLKV